MEKWLILGLVWGKCKMSLEHLPVPGSRKCSADTGGGLPRDKGATGKSSQWPKVDGFEQQSK